MKYERMTKAQKAAYNVFRKSGHTMSKDVSPAMRNYILERLIPDCAYLVKHSAWCSCCGGSFQVGKEGANNGDRVNCPHCGRQLEIVKTRRRKKEDGSFLQELTTVGKFQAIRMYEYNWFERIGDKRVFDVKLVYVIFLEEGKDFLDRYRFSVPVRQWYYRYTDPFGYGALELRNDNLCYREDPCRGWLCSFYPYRRIHPWMKKYDLSGNLLGSDIYERLLKIVSSNKYETMWKLRHKYPELSGKILSEQCNFESHYDAALVALRHKYDFPDIGMWVDHIDLLRMEGKDIHNPKFICPADIQTAHTQLLAARERRIERERRERERLAEERAELEHLKRREQDKKDDMQYAERMGKVLGIMITSGCIEIVPLQNVKDFYEEGKALHHCVYSNRYYKKADTIIFGARVNGERTETIEVNTKDFSIVQCRGRFNQNSTRHDEILKLMKDSMEQIKPYFKNSKQMRVV